ncbi:Stage II sporulation protein R (spore_II_R) [Paraliobacillus sp. PM-2]|uniref:stage II sporulation protein R n=1 Tax=Paraliobacillus sp. PM-2 TaxID=1462524 RepID=UPI00061C339D|nr:stage II sporulation protein R [Paraliobacillus sp. PM-2]CQR46150.1 Stage II sporulation protein R (spore_II_R) [Paraliobacillus sp. PM-2]
MKKHIVIVIISFIGLFILVNQLWINQEAAASDYQVIPDEAIRLRILANSDQEKDQSIKRVVRDEVNQEITKWVEELDSIEVARKVIQERLPAIEKIVERTLKQENIATDYQVNYGKEVNFPSKVYGKYVYPAGEYEAILITLGEGKGANWWCVLFPPLCFLDFSNGTTVAAAEEPEESEEPKEPKESRETKPIQTEEEKDVEVRFFFLEWFR